MARPLAPCLECGADVPEPTSTCPACGYDVGRHDRPRLVLGTLGMALSLTVVLAPVGLPLLWRARRHRLAADGTVTRREPDAVGEHLARVLRAHLGLGRPGAPAGDFLRGGSRDASTVLPGHR